MKTRVVVEYKLWLRGKTGVEREEVEADNLLLSRILSIIAEKHPKIKKYLEDPFKPENPIIILVDGKPVNRDVEVREGSVIKLLPPVSGG